MRFFLFFMLMMVFSNVFSFEKTVENICGKDAEIYFDIKDFNAKYILNKDSNCLQKLLSERETDPLRENSVFKTADLVSDVIELKDVLLKTYSGYYELSLQMDIDKFFEKHLNRLKEKKEWTLAEAIFPIYIEMQKYVLDRHFAFTVNITASLFEINGWIKNEYITDFPSESLLPLQKNCRFLTDEKDKRIGKIFENTLEKKKYIDNEGKIKTIIVISAFASSDKITAFCKMNNKEKKFDFTKVKHESPKERGIKVYSYIDNGDIGFIRLSSFQDKYNNELKQFVNDAVKHKNHKYLVIDLRNNTGGSTEYIEEWLTKMNIQKNDSLFIGWNDINNKESGALSYNSIVRKYILYKTDKDLKSYFEKEMEHRFESLQKESSIKLNDVLVNFPAKVENDSNIYNGKIIFLQNRYTFSAAEDFLFIANNNNNILRFGERSGGMLVYGNVVEFISGKTGIVWRIPNRKFKFYQTIKGIITPIENIEGNGFSVDYYLSPNLSYDEINKVIKENHL